MKEVVPTGGMQKYIYDQEKLWFSRLEPFVFGNVVKIGSGLGYMTSFIRENAMELKILETNTNKNDVNKDLVRIYDGAHFPFEDDRFDCSIATYVLHHTMNPIRVIREMKRVSKRLIILEETYSNLVSKLDLVYRDVYVNTLAGQPSKIQWNSYFQDGELSKILEDLSLKVIHTVKEKKRSYFKVLYVLDKVESVHKL